MSDYIINKPDDFELNETLECGQCFHFKKLDENDYVLTAFGHMLHIMQTEKKLCFMILTRSCIWIYGEIISI